MFDNIEKNQMANKLNEFVYFDSARVLSRKKEVSSSGIYGWYVCPPKITDDTKNSEINDYFSSLSSVLGSDKTFGNRYSSLVSRVPVRVSSELSRDFIKLKADLLPLVSTFSAPIYVGYTKDKLGISQRIKSHLKDSVFKKHLASLIRKSGHSGAASPEDMLIKYFCFDDFLECFNINLKCEEREVLLRSFEASIFCLNFPFLNSKKGN